MLTVIGSINVDLVTTAARIPGPGETSPAVGFATHQGGKGSNVARAAQRIAGKGVRLVGAIGHDSFGDDALESLRNDNVNVDSVIRRDVHTGVATVLVDTKGENRILVFGGANDDVKPEVHPAIDKAIEEKPKFLLVQNEIPLESVLHIIRTASPETCVVYNPSPVDDKVPPSIWSNVGILVVNELEATAIAAQAGHSTGPIKNRDDAFVAADTLLSLGVRRAVVITLGAQGAIYAEAGEKGARGSVDAVKAGKVVDTTGAGDTFTGTLLAALGARGLAMEDALNYASAASGIAVTRPGAASSMPMASEVDELLDSLCS